MSECEHAVKEWEAAVSADPPLIHGTCGKCGATVLADFWSVLGFTEQERTVYGFALGRHCPVCGMGAGYLCETLDRNLRRTPHGQRLEA